MISQDNGNRGPKSPRQAFNASPFRPARLWLIAARASALAWVNNCFARALREASMSLLIGGPKPAGSAHVSSMRPASVAKMLPFLDQTPHPIHREGIPMPLLR